MKKMLLALAFIAALATQCAFSATTTSPLIASIEVTPATATLAVNATQLFTATCKDGNGVAIAPPPVVTWTVSGGGTINSGGLFTATTVGGPFTVTAAVPPPVTGTSATPNGNVPAVVGTASVTVVASRPPPVLTTIDVAPSSVTVPVGGTQQFTPTAKDQYGNVLYLPAPFFWAVSGGGTISEFGLFTATTAGGPFTVTANVGSVSGTATVTVIGQTPPPPVLAKILVSPPNATVLVGGTVPFNAVGVDQNGVPVSPQPIFSWTVSGGGTIDTHGVFSAVTAGGQFTVTATVATSAANAVALSGTASVTVVSPTPPPPVLAKILVSPPNATVLIGGNVPFTAVGVDQNGVPVSPQPVFGWTVSGGGTIDVNGVFTAATAGGPFVVAARVGPIAVPVSTTTPANTTSTPLVGTANVTVVSPTPPPPVLTKILVTPPNAIVVVGGTVPFSAVGVDQYGNPVSPQPTFLWSVSGGGTIDTNGVFTAVTAGGPFDVIAATSPGNTTVPSIFGKASVTVTAEAPPPPILTSIVVQPADGRVAVGGTVPFVATAFDQNGAPIVPPPAFTWTAGGGGTINTSGVFTATTVGGPFLVTATAVTPVSNTAVPVSGSATVTVVPPPPPSPVLTKVIVTPATTQIPIGGVVPFTAVGVDQNGVPVFPPASFSWTVSGGGTINASGVFAATTAGGPFTVTATAISIAANPVAISGTASVTVVPSPIATMVLVSPKNATVPVGGKLPYVAVVVDQNSAALRLQPSVTWSVSGGGTIDANGVFTATTAGGPFTVTATVATLVANAVAISGTASVTVVQPLPTPIQTRIVVSPPQAVVAVGGTEAFTALVKDQNGKPLAAQPAVTWSVSGGGTIDVNGVFTAVTAGGPYNVVATAGNLMGGALVEVTATQVLTSIQISPQTLTVPINSQVPFIAIALDQNGFPINPPPAITWTVSGGGTINASGVFSATTAGGPFTVTAAAGAISGTAQVLVSSASTKPVVKALAVTPSSITIPNGGEQPFMALAKDANGNPINPQPAIAWSVSGGGTIDSTGVFTAATVGGPYTVTAAVGNITGTAEVTVAGVASNANGATALAFVSGPFAAPNPCFVGCPVQFFAPTSGTAPFTYAWNFGDGSTDTNGPGVAHSYATAGTYSAGITVTDSTNASVTATLSIVVNPVPLVRLSGRVYPAETGADLLTVTGQLQNVAANANLSGQTVVLTLGGVSETFVLSANGSGTNADGSISISAKKGTFSVKLKGSYGAEWVAAGIFDPTLPGGSFTLNVSLTIDSNTMSLDAVENYTSRKGVVNLAPGK